MADYRKWMHENIGAVAKGDELDIETDQYLQEQDLNRDVRDKFETKFIDEVYNVSDARWLSDKDPTETAIRGDNWDDGDVIWGLDLRRVDVDEDGDPVKIADTSEYYEHLTKGKVDWASYYNDNAFNNAFDRIRADDNLSKNQDDKFAWVDDYKTLKEAFTDDGDDSRISDKRRVEFIREAQQNQMGKSDRDDPDPDYVTGSKWENDPANENSWWNKWDNKFIPPDPNRIKPYDPVELDIDESKVGRTIRTDIATPTKIGSTRDIHKAAADAGVTIRH